MPESGNNTYRFNLNMDNETWEIAFLVNDSNIDSSCTCSYEKKNKLCKHRYYVLAGRTYRMHPDEVKDQSGLIKRVSMFQGGRDLISFAKTQFTDVETCRRCNSRRVITLKKSLLGSFIRIFINKNRRYFCLKCRWSW